MTDLSDLRDLLLGDLFEIEQFDSHDLFGLIIHADVNGPEGATVDPLIDVVLLDLAVGDGAVHGFELLVGQLERMETRVVRSIHINARYT